MHQQKLLLLYRLIYEDHNRSIVFCSFSSSLEYKNQNVSDYMPLSTTKIIVIAGTTSRKKKSILRSTTSCMILCMVYISRYSRFLTLLPPIYFFNLARGKQVFVEVVNPVQICLLLFAVPNRDLTHSLSLSGLVSSPNPFQPEYSSNRKIYCL